MCLLYVYGQGRHVKETFRLRSECQCRGGLREDWEKSILHRGKSKSPEAGIWGCLGDRKKTSCLEESGKW